MNKVSTYIRISLRDRVSLLLGIGSLMIGITVSLIVGIWYMYEQSYDNFHPDADNIYRICRKAFIGGESKILGSEFNPLGKNITKEFIEVTDAMRMYPLQGEEKIKVAERNVFADQIKVVSSNFFDFFDYKFKEGNVQSFKDNPNSIIIDEYLAKKLFPNENPIGKIVSVYGNREVVGVLKKLPNNTHLKMHALLPIESIESINNKSWGNADFYITYVKLAKNVDKEVLAKKIKNYTTKECKPYQKIELEYLLQPLKEIHLSTGFTFEEELGVKKGSPKTLLTFLCIAILILLIAIINFVNLFISSASLRAKAIGLKKVNGAKRWQIVVEFINETFFYTLTATTLAVFFSVLILPYFSQFIGYEFIIDFSDWKLWSILIGLSLFISVIAGSIPGLYMSSFQTLETLKGRFRGKRIIRLQKVLVISQFTASIALLIAVFFINKQVRFMNTVDLGFSKEQLVYVNIPQSFVDNIQSIQNELEKSPLIKGTCISNGTSLKWTQGNSLASAETPDDQIIVETKEVQKSYFDVYGFKIIAGENTLREELKAGYGTECLINEAAAKALKLKKPYVGKQVDAGFRGIMTVTGIVKDAYTKSLSQKIDPQLYVNLHDIWSGMSLMVKANGTDMKPVVELLRKQWNAREMVYPFEYHFLDKEYEALYQAEQQASILASWAMGIALFLTIAGLWGMARYSSDRRTKEIGIRKVNGATILEVISMLNGEFLCWVIISFIIAVPLACYAIQLWLENFELRTNLSWWIFALAGIVALGVALLTVSWQSYRAASRNPVEALRYE